jgi:hypothetical protein
VGKYRPVPRTLSDIIRKVSQAPLSDQEPVELLSPEQLRAAGQVSMQDPSILFKGVTVVPSPPAPLPEEMKTPGQLFGKQAFATPGSPLKGLAEMLPPRRQPTSPLPPPRPPRTDQLRPVPPSSSSDNQERPPGQASKTLPLSEPKPDPGTF